MPGRPSSSCAACKAKRIRCVLAAGADACWFCKERGLAAKCDAAAVVARRIRVQRRPQDQQEDDDLPRHKRRLPLKASPPTLTRVAPETTVLLEVALRSNVMSSFSNPAAVGLARRVVSATGDLSTPDAVAARAVLHAVAAAGALSTCDGRYAMQASANLCLARALVAAPGAARSPLLPFAYLAMVECGVWARSLPTIGSSLAVAAALGGGLPMPAKPCEQVMDIAAAVLRTPRLPHGHGAPLPEGMDPFDEDVGLRGTLECLGACMAQVHGREPVAIEVPWASLSRGSPRLRVFRAMQAVAEVVVVDEMQVRPAGAQTLGTLRPVLPGTRERVALILDALDLPIGEDWCSTMALTLRAVCHLQLRDMDAAVADTRAALTLALRDPRVLAASVVQRATTSLINAWRGELSAAGEPLAPLLEAAAQAMADVYESLHLAARVVFADAMYTPPALVSGLPGGLGLPGAPGGDDVDVDALFEELLSSGVDL